MVARLSRLQSPADDALVDPSQSSTEMASLSQLDEESLRLQAFSVGKAEFRVLAPKKSRHLNEKGNANKMPLIPCPTVLMRELFFPQCNYYKSSPTRLLFPAFLPPCDMHFACLIYQDFIHLYSVFVCVRYLEYFWNGAGYPF